MNLSQQQIDYINASLEQEAAILASPEWVVSHEALLVAGEALRAWCKAVYAHHPRFAEIVPLFESNRPAVHRRLERLILELDANTIGG